MAKSFVTITFNNIPDGGDIISIENSLSTIDLDENFTALRAINGQTTIGTPDGDGDASKLHGVSGITYGNGGIYSIYNEDDPDLSINAQEDILNFFRDNPDHTVVTWMAGHSHAYLDETYNGRGDRYDIHGVTFYNIGHLTVYHTDGTRPLVDPMSNLMTIDGNTVNFKLYLHKAVGVNPIGFYTPKEFEINLKV